MITRIAVENFKGIGNAVEIPIRPITLLFGPNSAGKSTVMHAFHYAREVFERHNLNADRTIAGGEFIDLGGFGNFVHDHRLDNVITLRFDMKLEPDRVDFPRYSPGELYISIIDVPWQQPIETASVEVKIAWNKDHNRPYVSRYAVGLNGKDIGWIECEKNAVVLRYFDINHPVFQPPKKEGEEAEHSPIMMLFADALEGREFGQGYMFDIVEQQDALPPCDRTLQVVLGRGEKKRPGFDPESDHASEQRELVGVLSQVFVGMAEVMRDELRRFCYLGPLREKPPREYMPPRFPDPSRWATGLGAWDALSTGDESLLIQVNLWMQAKEFLNTGYGVWRKAFLMLDPESALYTQLVTHSAFDEIEDLAAELHKMPERTQLILQDERGLQLAIQDVGEGIAQVLPVVVAVLCPDASVVQVEQPELHLHPTQQAALGDLLIRGALGKPSKPLIMETHSEHLILRLLRRIRETTKIKETSAEGKKPFMGVPVTPADVAILYARLKDGQTTFMQIDVDQDGELVQPWPDDFFEQDFHERFA